ncbi:hypothetical protein GCM10010485_22340 [Streptosporangium carneum]
MVAVAGERGTMREELSAAADPVLARIREHPFWDGLRNGTLPPVSLRYFAEHDVRHVVPAYARAMARCAALADHDAHGALLCSAASATFGSLPRLDSELAGLAETIGGTPGGGETGGGTPGVAGTGGTGTGGGPPGPAVHAYVSFMSAASCDSFVSGLGGLLPMTWFHLEVSGDLRRRHDPGSRYSGWIEQYCPWDGYPDYVEAYLNVVDEVGGRCSADERNRLVRHFLLAARHEWAFAEAAWQCQEWMVW